MKEDLGQFTNYAKDSGHQDAANNHSQKIGNQLGQVAGRKRVHTNNTEELRYQSSHEKALLSILTQKEMTIKNKSNNSSPSQTV